MKYDKKIKSMIENIKYKCDSYIGFVNSCNECASTDRLIESIINQSKELEKYHNKRFEDLEKNNNKKEKVR